MLSAALCNGDCFYYQVQRIHHPAGCRGFFFLSSARPRFLWWWCLWGCISSLSLQNLGKAFIAIFIRMVLGLFVGWGISLLFGLEGLTSTVVIVGASLPIGFNTLIFADMEDLDKEFAANHGEYIHDYRAVFSAFADCIYSDNINIRPLRNCFIAICGGLFLCLKYRVGNILLPKKAKLSTESVCTCVHAATRCCSPKHRPRQHNQPQVYITFSDSKKSLLFFHLQNATAVHSFNCCLKNWLFLNLKIVSFFAAKFTFGLLYKSRGCCSPSWIRHILVSS